MSTTKSRQRLSDRYSNNHIGEKDSTHKRRKVAMPVIALTSIIAFIVVGVAVALVVLESKGKDSDTSVQYNLLTAPPDNIDELREKESVKKAAEGTYDVCMNSTWRFDSGDSVSDNAYVENILSNTHTVKFSLARDDNGKVIYESPYIPVGSSLRNIKLSDGSLTKGTYPCTLTYHLVDDSYNELSTLNISVSVIILN